MLSTGATIHLAHGDLLDRASRKAPAARDPLGYLENTPALRMSYLVFSHQAWAEVSGVKLQPEGRFMVLLSALDSKRLWSQGQEDNSPVGKAARRAAGQHLESPVPTGSPGPCGPVDWAERWKERCPVGLGGTAPPTRLHYPSAITGSDGCCPPRNPLSHISEVLVKHARNVRSGAPTTAVED